MCNMYKLIQRDALTFIHGYHINTLSSAHIMSQIYNKNTSRFLYVNKRTYNFNVHPLTSSTFSL